MIKRSFLIWHIMFRWEDLDAARKMERETRVFTERARRQCIVPLCKGNSTAGCLRCMPSTVVRRFNGKGLKSQSVTSNCGRYESRMRITIPYIGGCICTQL